jgi:hypothetical protein
VCSNFLTPFNPTLLFFYVLIFFLNPLFRAPSTTSGVFCDLHKAPAPMCSLKG